MYHLDSKSNGNKRDVANEIHNNFCMKIRLDFKVTFVSLRNQKLSQR